MLTQYQNKSQGCEGGISNTPLDSQSQSVQPQTCPITGLAVHLDWIQGTGQCDDIYKLLVSICGNEYWAVDEYKRTMGCHQFEWRARTPYKHIVMWYEQWYNARMEAVSPPSSPAEAKGLSMRYIYHLQIPGSPMSAMSMRDGCMRLYVLTHFYGFKATRIDIALDDYCRQLDIELMKQAHKDGNVSGFKKCRLIEESHAPGSPFVPTLYLGSTRKMTRVYDAIAKHPDIDATRIELQLRENNAKVFQLAFCAKDLDIWECPQVFQGSDIVDNPINPIKKLADTLTGYVIGNVDFIDKKDKNLERNERLSWWQDFIDRCSVIEKLHKPSVVVTFQSTDDWFKRQLKKRLAVLRDAFGDIDFKLYLKRLIDDGRDKMTKYDLALVTAFKKEIASMRNGDKLDYRVMYANI